ncbi:MAG: hypothetical protein ABIQ59_04475 [Nocardioidaceae bacterium]
MAPAPGGERREASGPVPAPSRHRRLPRHRSRGGRDRLGRTDEALAAYATALDLVPPDGTEARMLLRRVSELGGT